MPEITDFEAAVAAVSGLTQDPGNATKLELYALYKQATQGDVSGKRPGFTDFAGRAKYDAWAGLTGTSPDEAKSTYVAKVNELVAAEV